MQVGGRFRNGATCRIYQYLSHSWMTCLIVISAGVWGSGYACHVLSASFDLNDGDGGDILHLSGPKLELMSPSFVKLWTRWPCYICRCHIDFCFLLKKDWTKYYVPKQNLINLLCDLAEKTFWELEVSCPAHMVKMLDRSQHHGETNSLVAITLYGGSTSTDPAAPNLLPNGCLGMDGPTSSAWSSSCDQGGSS